MDPVLKWSAVAALGAAVFAGVSIGYVALEFRDTPAAVNSLLGSAEITAHGATDLEGSLNAVTVPAVNRLVSTATTAAGTANVVLKAAKSSVDTVNRLCPTPDDPHPKTCGTLADVAEFLHTGRGMMGTIEMAGYHEDKQLTTLDSQERDLFTDLHTTIADAQPIETSAAKLLATPSIPAILDNSQKITGDAARITRDAADEADKLAHPPKVKLGFWGGVWAAAKYVHQLEPPIF